MFKELYKYREFLKDNVKKEIRGKYKGSFLGVLWSFVNPLLMTLVYAIVFPYLMRGAGYEHYTTFLIIGILAWNWFSISIAQGTFVVLGNSGIIKKVYFPREILPISVVTSGMVNFLISLVIIAIFVICSGIGFSWHLIFLPLAIIAQYFLTLTIVFVTSAIDVYVRDIEYIINFVVQMLFYATPILYSIDLFKGTKLYSILKLNPMGAIIDSYRDILYWHHMPHIKSLLIVLFISIVLCYLAYKFFIKLSKGFAEEV